MHLQRYNFREDDEVKTLLDVEAAVSVKPEKGFLEDDERQHGIRMIAAFDNLSPAEQEEVLASIVREDSPSEFNTTN